MTDSGTASEGNQLTLISRLTDGLVRRRWRFLAAELILVVAGILIALAIDGWVSDMRDRQTEASYLELLSRDLGELRQQAQLQMDFENQQIDYGVEVYKLLGSPDPAANKTRIRSLLGMLSTRRTLNLSSATFDEIISSGHLQLIKNRELRHRIVSYFAQMELRERIAEKNNQDLIDDVYVPFLMRAGITVVHDQQAIEAIQRATQIQVERLGPDVEFPEDRVLDAPADSDSWNDIRRNVYFRIRIASAGQAGAELILDATDNIAEAIANELRIIGSEAL